MSRALSRTLLGIAIVAVVLGSGYWFFMYTVRGGSFALYTIGGLNAPASVHWACAHETNPRVDAKFELPLAFDEKTKGELKGFWYYSYFRECLFRHGYDFKGNDIIPSLLSKSNGVLKYKNPYVGFGFTVFSEAEFYIDNALNVDYDDSLLFSTLKMATTTLIIEAYTKHDYFKSFGDIESSYAAHPFSKKQITSTTVLKNAQGIDVLLVKEDDTTTRVVFMAKDGHVINMYTKNVPSDIMDGIIQTISPL